MKSFKDIIGEARSRTRSGGSKLSKSAFPEKPLFGKSASEKKAEFEKAKKNLTKK